MLIKRFIKGSNSGQIAYPIKVNVIVTLSTLGDGNFSGMTQNIIK